MSTGIPPTADASSFSPSSLKSTSDNTTKKDRRVSFDSVIIREYNRVIGDNPSVSSGPAISLGWEYSEVRTPSLDEYENTRGKRRSKIEMVMPRHIREQILKMECECSRADIAGCIRQINQIKFQRRKTVHNLNSAKTEERLENFQRKLSQMMCARKRIDAHIQEWWYANAEQWKE